MLPHDALSMVRDSLMSSPNGMDQMLAEDIGDLLRLKYDTDPIMDLVFEYVDRRLRADLHPSMSLDDLDSVASWQLAEGLRNSGLLGDNELIILNARLSENSIYSRAYDVQVNVWDVRVEDAGGGFQVRVLANSHDEAVEFAKHTAESEASRIAAEIGLGDNTEFGVADAELVGGAGEGSIVPYTHGATRQ